MNVFRGLLWSLALSLPVWVAGAIAMWLIVRV